MVWKRAGNEDVLSGSHNGSQYLRIFSYTSKFQGPVYDIDVGYHEYMLLNIEYLFQAKIRISSSDRVSSSQCSNLSQNYPILQIGYLDGGNDIRLYPLAKFNGVNF